MKKWLFLIYMVLCVSLAFGQTLLPRKFPSARVAHVIPGGDTYQAPTDREAIDTLLSLYGRADADAVKLWESQFADLASGGHTGVAAYNANYRATDYVYFQSLFTAIDTRETGLRKVAIRNGWDYEGFHIHFKEDTWVDGNRLTQTGTVFHGRPNLLGATRSWLDSGSTYSWNEAITYSNQGGGCWVLMPEKFAEMTVFIATGGDPGTNGELLIEYPNAVDENFRITGWGRVTPTYDGTNGLRQTGTIKWIPPADWKWCVPYPPYLLGQTKLGQGCGAYLIRFRTPNYVAYPTFGTNEAGYPVWMRSYINLETTSLRTGAVVAATLNTLRIDVKGDAYTDQYRATDYYKNMTVEITSGRGGGQTRTITASGSGLNTITLTVSPEWDEVPDNTSRYRISGPTIRIPGWDPANDRNGDGYVDDTEYANLANPGATARFKWEARLTSAFGGWSPYNATIRTNLWSTQYRNALLTYYSPYFRSLNLSGYHNDDALLLLGGGAPTLAGGRLIEYASGNYPIGVVGKDYNMETSYRDAFLAAHNLFKTNGFMWVGTNVSNNNMIVDPFRRAYLSTFTFFCCEQTLMDSAPLTSYVGILRNWYLLAYAAAGVRSVVLCQTGYSNYISYLGNTREAWERLTENKLAMFYLLNVPDYTFFQNWNRTYVYGSANTIVGTSTRGFWKAGVPQNMAYTPVKMLQVDIGEPANSIPGNYEPIVYILGVVGVSGYGFYHHVGNSTQTSLSVPVLEGGTLQVPVVPTYAFYLWRTSETTYGIPNDAVVARVYTKGLVLCRMPAIDAPGGYASYIADPITVQLPGGPYRRVNYDGTLGPPVTEISIRGYEGIILVKAAETNVPNIQLTMSVDKSNPRPMDLVTVTIEAKNTGSEAISNVEVRVPINNMTYEQGSLSPQEFTVDTSDPSVLKITIPALAAGGTVTFQFRLVVR